MVAQLNNNKKNNKSKSPKPDSIFYSGLTKSFTDLLKSTDFSSHLDAMRDHINTMPSFSFHHSLKSSFSMTILEKAYLNIMDNIKTIDPFYKAMESFKSHYRLLDSFSSMNENVSQIQKMLSGIEVDKQLMNTKKLIEVFFKQNSGAYVNTFAEFKEVMADINNVDIQVNKDGTITADKKVYESKEVQSLVNGIIDDFDFRHGSTEEVLNRLLIEIRKSNNPIVKQFFVNLIITLLITFIIVPRISEFQKTTNTSNSKRVTKIIKTELSKQEFENIDFSLLRIVSATCLNVRKKNSRKSAILGKIYLGNVVTFIERRKNWTLIEWASEDNELIIKGWVYSRYLEKVK